MITPSLLAPALLRAPADVSTSRPSAAQQTSPAYQLAVDHLAEMVGVEPSYYDVAGTHHIASTTAKAAVLTALGYDTETEDSTLSATQALCEQRAQQVVGPVVVLRRRSEQQLQWFLPLKTQPGVSACAFSWQITTEDGQDIQGSTASAQHEGLWGVPLLASLPDGYHRLRLAAVDNPQHSEETALIVAPARCWLPAGQAPEQTPRLWGVGAQLYALRSERNWGMGDLADLRSLCTLVGSQGGDVVGLNPIHALFLPKPEDASPYSPNSRLFLNPLYIAIDAVPEYATGSTIATYCADPATQQALAAVNEAQHVAYTAVSAVKMAALRALFQDFSALPAEHPRQDAYRAFLAEGGERLRLFTIFQALQDQFGTAPWPQWPSEYHTPASAAVAAFAEQHPTEVAFHGWLQFETDRQLAAAAEALRQAGGSLGLYRDLAVGASPDGADVWMDPQAYVRGARFGAPPDALGPLGQDWGLPPFNPQALQQMGYAPFIEMVRANMRHAGALRIDHAMALQHLFWIPPGLTAVDGLYVSYPFSDMLGILALESQRAQCMIIGEDLGTVPEGFREIMAAEGLLSYRLFYFERYASGLFKRPDTYPPLALATPTSHDLATILGHWAGWDIALRHDLGLCGEAPDRAADEERRRTERGLLHAALVDQGLLPADFPEQAPLSAEQESLLIAAFHGFLARSPALLMLANLDDLSSEVTQVNVPGTVAEYPNWRRRLALPLEALGTHPAFTRSLATIAAERP